MKANTTSVERVSSGKRVNNAGDDAAGASIINRMTSQVQGMSGSNKKCW